MQAQCKGVLRITFKLLTVALVIAVCIALHRLVSVALQLPPIEPGLGAYLITATLVVWGLSVLWDRIRQGETE